ncbi:hypothetical protein [Streptomyces sp. NPDC126503]|uniref:hypothetical protein n=1 Tax=Streptomyces sp. NPDC126503 TaxID=3155315 RepID=UPI00331D0BDA
MADFLAAAFAVPTMVLTAALAAVVGFWLLVLCRAVAADAFDADVSAEALRCGHVPVAVAGSVFVAAGWVIDLTGMLLLRRADLSGMWSLPLSVALLAISLTLSWQVTRWLGSRMSKRTAVSRRSLRRTAVSHRDSRRAARPRSWRPTV